MKRKILILITLFLSVAGFSVSCSRDDDSNTPMTTESIVGKKYFSDKVYKCDWDEWVQTEILFAENNTAYLTCIETIFGTDRETRTEVKKASFNMAYPNIIFEMTNNDGSVKSFYASFSSNNSMVFEGQHRDLEGMGVPLNWEEVKGVNFSTNPQTITGPFQGQAFGYIDAFDSLQNAFRLGIDYAYWGVLYELRIDYPNMVWGTNNFSNIEVEGHFVNSDTIIITKLWREDEDLTCIRIR